MLARLEAKLHYVRIQLSGIQVPIQPIRALLPTKRNNVAYKPIEDYGVIGDLHTVALVGIDGSIDWCCLPRFDSPSTFAALLDDEKGGYFKISTVATARRKQLYMPDTNVLITRCLSPEGIAEIIDFMPIERRSLRYVAPNYHQIVRRVSTVAGDVRKIGRAHV